MIYGTLNEIIFGHQEIHPPVQVNINSALLENGFEAKMQNAKFASVRYHWIYEYISWVVI